MSLRQEIEEMEEKLRQAELGPDPHFFEEALADDVILIASDGDIFIKEQVVEAHRPDSEVGQKFTRVEMSEMEILDHGDAAVVTCKGRYEGPKASFSLRFVRTWLKKNSRWQVISAFVFPIHD